MAVYPCPACGGVAEEPSGCRRCGRPHDPQAAALAELNRRLAGLADNQSQLQAERDQLQAQAEALRASLRRQLTVEAAAASRPELPAPTVAAGPALPQAVEAVPAQRRAATQEAQPVRTGEHRPPGAPAQPKVAPTGPDDGAPSAPVAAEPPSGRNTLLALGGVLLGIAAAVVTGLFYTAAPTWGRAAILGVATLIALTLPLLIARRRLTATAETLAGFGLLALLLDGYAAYLANLAGLQSMPFALYSSLLCGLVGIVAAAYRLASHLRAPQFATLLVVQPVLPLLAWGLHADRDGFGVVFAVVAALNLGSVEILGRDPGRALPGVRLPGLAPGPGGQPWPRWLREVAWVSFGATLATSVVLSVIGLAVARITAQALVSALVLLFAAAVGAAGGLLSRRAPFGQIGGAAATLALIAGGSRVFSLAVPRSWLVLTAALAAVVALGCALLPARARPGPRWGSLLGAGLAAAVVVSTVVHSTVATIRASVTPAVWSADVSAFADHVRSAGFWFEPAGQVPLAAALLTIVAVAAAPSGWRTDALVAGLLVVTLSLPGTGAVAWWAVPVLTWAMSTVDLAVALPARRPASAAIRAGSAGVLALVAVAVGLARPGLTATTCALVAFTAAGIAVGAALWRDRLGPYADRVADAAIGAGACTLPVAVGTTAHLANAPGRVLVPVTVLATAIGVLAAGQPRRGEGRAASSGAAQRSTAGLAHARAVPEPGVAAAGRRGSAAGAVGAAAGALLLTLRVSGTAWADIALAALLLAAATVAVTTRPAVTPTVPAAGPGGPADGARGAASTGGKWWRLSGVDGPTIAVALGTAGLVLATARLAAVLLPGTGLVLTTTAVLIAALSVAALPRDWKPGPRLGTVGVGASVVTLVAGVAIVEAARTLAAAWPYWHADLAAYPARVTGIVPYGIEVPVSLLLAGIAAATVLPKPVNVDTFFVLLCLGGLALPAVLALPWWSPPLIAGGFATVAGLAAALGGDYETPGTHRRRLGMAALLTGYTLAAGGATPLATATVLSGLTAAAVAVTFVAALRRNTPRAVAGIAAATALAASPAAAGATAVAGGVDRAGVLWLALAVCALDVLAVLGLRRAHIDWDGYPGVGVGVAALLISASAAGLVPLDADRADPTRAAGWAAACALLATLAAGHSRRHDEDFGDPRPTRVVVGTLYATAVPAGLFAAAMSLPASVSALVGPFRTLSTVWAGYPSQPEPRGAAAAVLTLFLLAPTSGGIALILGGRRYLLAAVLPPLAAAAIVLPGALGASREAVPWVALGVALAAGLGAALSRPSDPLAATWLRTTAGVVCLISAAAGLAGSLATRATTLGALAVLAAGGLLAALVGRDPEARAVAWGTFAAAGFALPPVAYLARGAPLRGAAFGMLAVSAVLIGLGWALSRRAARYPDATVVEVAAALGAAAALALTWGSLRYGSAALTICGVLLGGAALRQDRAPSHRVWLVRLALLAEVGACWLLLYGVHIGLPEAYTLPFALAALVAGIVESRRRPELSSWLVYGPALGGAFLPSVALILVGDHSLVRWVIVFFAAVAVVIVGALRNWRAPVVTGATTAVLVAVVEMFRLLMKGQIAGALLVGLAGALLIVFGAFVERRLRRR